MRVQGCESKKGGNETQVQWNRIRGESSKG